MGSSGSKSSIGNSSSSSAGRVRSKGSRIFQSSCLARPSRSHDSDNDDHICNNRKKESGSGSPSANQTETESDPMKIEGFRRAKVEQSVEIPCIPSNIELDDWDQASVTDAATRTGGSSARASSNQSQKPSSRFLSRFSLIPGNLSFRLSRATSLGSSRSYPVSSTSLSNLNNEDELDLHTEHPRGFVHRDETLQGSDLLPSSQVDRTPTQCYGDTTSNFRFNIPASSFSDNLQYDQTIPPIHGVARDRDTTRVVNNVNLYSPRIHTESESNETRLSERRTGAREPVERNFRFSRTLSVGRLRDRVLRRSSLSDLAFCPTQQEREERHNGDRQAWNAQTSASASEGDAVTSPTTSAYTPSNFSSSLFSTQDYEVQTTRQRERYHDLLEHRSNFLERRRRIRSQVRALQRLGSRFENLSGHERSCIISGQHRTGRCTCRINNRDINSNDNTGARASISRIVMLAEALFEVLDEIHQQSVVLSSRPSVSSIGSVPAPSEAVESLPVKSYSKLQKHQNEEVPQCYICLVEYEEGDRMRILPCYHEFHRTCVDKWLKEIHRVCPLCRRDICKSDTLSADN